MIKDDQSCRNKSCKEIQNQDFIKMLRFLVFGIKITAEIGDE